MVRLADLSNAEREHLLEMVHDIPEFSGRPWVAGPPLGKRRIALITTSGIHHRDDDAYSDGASALDYRIIAGDVASSELVMSHLSSNFDRTGFQLDANVVFPIDRLRELAASGEIGSVADFHYAFMGAAPLPELEPKARNVAALLKRDAVDAVLLTPV